MLANNTSLYIQLLIFTFQYHKLPNVCKTYLHIQIETISSIADITISLFEMTNELVIKGLLGDLKG